MAFIRTQNVRIAGVSAAIPKNIESNQDLANIPQESIDLLVQTTGIKSRRIAPKSISASYMCFASAEKLLNELNWDRSEIEILIFVSQTPDQPIPGSSMLLQERLGLSKSCMAMDLNQGCAGYVYGLSTIMSLMSASKLKKGLLLVGDTITHLLDENDQSTVPIFSDAGTATALEFDPDAEDAVFNLQTDGKGYSAIQQKKEERMTMNGHEVFHFGLKEVVPNIKSTLENSETQIEAIDHFIFHQANLLLNESIRKKLKVPAEKVPYTLNELGNTSCATIPITLVSSLGKELTNTHKTCLLSGFGVGLSWGSGIVNFSKCVCPDLIEIE
ncbi:MAG: ketoacyl-ACP synthase III [Crocinitomicaceae bacterium]|nr:ketoacyl-ACP synthase III [Crocinitomicaceae bacterium]